MPTSGKTEATLAENLGAGKILSMPPALLLLAGIVTVVGAIVLLRLNAFLALVLAAIVVSLLTPGDPAVKITRVAEGFGRTAGSIGIVIALAAIIGEAMTRSGAADRIVAGFVSLLGEKRGATALGATGFVLSIPVFFDTVFYLLVPLARSMRARTGRDYIVYLMAIAGGAAATHTLVPPTPGPLAVAAALGVDLGTMVLGGFAVALPGAVAALAFARWTGRRLTIEPPDGLEGVPPAMSQGAGAHPSLLAAALPIILPVLLISSNTLAVSLAGVEGDPSIWTRFKPYGAVIGNANFALLLASAVAITVFARQRRASRDEVGRLTETSLAGAGMIILITAAGGAFGASLQAAQIGPAIQAMVPGAGQGFAVLPLAFGVSSLIKIAQGSSTVAMITTAGMLAAMLPDTLPFHRLYVATAIGSGSLVGTWMNDSGFWVFSKMGGVPELTTLRTWTPVAAVVGVTAMLTTLLLARLLPLT
ncbi:MAG TPA: SLC13 family permease [Gemmatimonadaceae bacterium]|nr:SLC13 family permease [Gemmatimonadaceae bacterium]